MGHPGGFGADVSTTTAAPANGVEQSPRLKRSNLMAATAAELEQLRRLKPDSRLLVPIKAGQASRLWLLGYDSIGYYDDLRSLDAVEFMDLLIPYDGSDDREKNAAVIAADALRRHYPHRISCLDIAAKHVGPDLADYLEASMRSDAKSTPKVLLNRLYERAEPVQRHRQRIAPHSAFTKRRPSSIPRDQRRVADAQERGVVRDRQERSFGSPNLAPRPIRLRSCFSSLSAWVTSSSAASVHFTRPGPTRHYLVFFAAMVGLTSAGRKGTSLYIVRSLLSLIDPDWAATRVLGGLVSGEGLITRRSRPIVRESRGRAKGEPGNRRRFWSHR